MACKKIVSYLQEKVDVLTIPFEESGKTLGEYTLDELMRKGDAIVGRYRKQRSQWKGEWKAMMREH